MSVFNPAIRAACPSDVPALHALVHRAYRGEQAARSWSHEGELPAGERVGADALAAMIADPACSVLVADGHGDLVGTALIEGQDTARARISLLSVAPEFQGSGLGDRLLRGAEQEAHDRFAARTVTIEVLEHKVRLLGYYERRGYRRTGSTKPYPHRLSHAARFLLLDKDIG